MRNTSLRRLTNVGFLASWELAQGGRRYSSLLRSRERLLNKPAPLAPVSASDTKLVWSLPVARSSRSGDTSAESQILMDREAVDLTGCQGSVSLGEPTACLWR
jgi:hypothetical protein